MISFSESILTPSKNLVIGACMGVYMLEPFAMSQVDVSTNTPSLSEIKFYSNLKPTFDYKSNRNLQLLLEHQTPIKELIPEGQFKKERKYIKDGVRYVSEKESFINLGVDLFQLSTFIKQVGVLFDTSFNEDIHDPYASNKHMMIKVQIFSKKECVDMVEKELENCYKMKISFHSFDKFGSELPTFIKEVRNLPKVGFSNVSSNEIGEFQIFLNTKPEYFTPIKKENKPPLLEVSPFDVIG